MFDVSSEQLELRRSLRRCLEDPTRDAVAEFGLAGLVAPAEYGGADADLVDLAVVLEQLGGALACPSFLGSSVLAVRLLVELGDHDAMAAHLPGICSGALTAAVAIADQRGHWHQPGAGVVATPTDAGHELTGTKYYVLDGTAADVLLVTAGTGGELGVFTVAVDAPGLRRTAVETFDPTRPVAEIEFSATPAQRIGGPDVEDAVLRALDQTAIALAAEQLGGARRCLDMAVAYAKDRVQFGRAIGSFQAIKHLCADLLVDVESAHSAVYFAAETAREAAPGTRSAVASLAKALCSEVFVSAASSNVQIHGGMGFTWEHPAHRYLRRAHSSAALLGAAAAHRERLMTCLEDAPVDLTARVAKSSDAEHPDLRREVRDWIAENSSADMTAQEWRARVVDAGWAAPSWSKERFGRGLSGSEARAVDAEFAAAGKPGVVQERRNIPAATVYTYGSDDQKNRLLRGFLTGELVYCLLYSEPAAGSDLASLRTRADLVDGSYIVNGQKVWTSAAKQADYGLLLARTDWDAPKHQGISFLFLPMRQPGVDIRPMRQITGEAHFNEVFLTDAVAPAENLLGEPGDGWRILRTALGVERTAMGQRNMGELTHKAAPKGPSATTDTLLLARAHDRLDDPVIRQAVAKVVTLRAAQSWNDVRASVELRSGIKSHLPLLSKLSMSRLLHTTAQVHRDILGPASILDGPNSGAAAAANFLTLNAFFTSIGGGTDQIMRTIIGEQGLGLPREPEVDKNQPFRA